MSRLWDALLMSGMAAAAVTVAVCRPLREWVARWNAPNPPTRFCCPGREAELVAGSLDLDEGLIVLLKREGAYYGDPGDDLMAVADEVREDER